MLTVSVCVCCVPCREVGRPVTVHVGGVCYICKFKEGVGITNLLLNNQYFLLVICLYIQCLQAIHV
jgi:hypothetical protein